MKYFKIDFEFTVKDETFSYNGLSTFIK
jgi:hypothetical protein